MRSSLGTLRNEIRKCHCLFCFEILNARFLFRYLFDTDSVVCRSAKLTDLMVIPMVNGQFLLKTSIEGSGASCLGTSECQNGYSTNLNQNVHWNRSTQETLLHITPICIGIEGIGVGVH